MDKWGVHTINQFNVSGRRLRITRKKWHRKASNNPPHVKSRFFQTQVLHSVSVSDLELAYCWSVFFLFMEYEQGWNYWRKQYPWKVIKNHVLERSDFISINFEIGIDSRWEERSDFSSKFLLKTFQSINKLKLENDHVRFIIPTRRN